MNRATFLKRAALLAAGVVALGNEELLERLAWEPKKLWAGADLGQTAIPDEYDYYSTGPVSGYSFSFSPGDRVAIIRSGSLVEFGTVTSARPLTVQWPSRKMELNDFIVHAGPVQMS